MSALWGLGETSDAHVCRDPRDSRDPKDLRELRDSRECRDPRDPGTPEAPVIPGTRGPRNPRPSAPGGPVPISAACFAGRPVWYLAWTLMQRQDVGQPV